MIAMLLCTACLMADLRAQVLADLQGGQPARAEFRLLEAVDRGEAIHHDLLLLARLERRDTAAAMSVLLPVLDEVSAGGVLAGPLEAHLQRDQLMFWTLPPWVPEGVEREALIEQLQVTQAKAVRAQGVQGALLSILTGRMQTTAQQAPTIWRDAALAMAGDPRQRAAARARLHRSKASPAERAWRLHVIGRSFLLESSEGAHRRGLVRLAQIVNNADMAQAHPLLALASLDTLEQASNGLSSEHFRQFRQAMEARLARTMDQSEHVSTEDRP
jgi:hypothetical protein